MDSNKILKIVIITICSLFSLFVILVAGLWIYKERSSSLTSSDAISNDMYGLLGDGYSGRSDSDIPVDATKEQTPTSQASEEESLNVIRNGYIGIAVDDIDATLESISKVQEKFDATYTSLNDTGKGKTRMVSMLIKVKETDFDKIYAELKGLEGEYLSSSISENDVTEMVKDLNARLKNYKGVETQFLEILKTAKSVEDTLAVYKELNEVRMNIETVETDLKNIGTQTDYSYISMSVSQSSAGAELTDNEWKPLGVLKDASRALVSFAKFFVSALIWFVVFIPVVALVVVPVIIIQKRSNK
ncbi:MAG: DUF4349 domain-containing protein [Candidatus Dojkabacteria bacterium]